MKKDSVLQVAQLRGGLDTELFSQETAEVGESLQGFRLPAQPVERNHQLPAQALSQGILLDQVPEPIQHLCLPAECQLCVDGILERHEAQFIESADLRLGKRLISEIGQRRSSP